MATDLREESFLARPEQTRAGSLPLLARWLMVALAYYFAGQLGLLFATVAGNVSPLWPASGVALAVLLLYGTDLWPAIALGASVLSLTTHGVGIGALTCVPNTLEPLLAALLLERAGFDNRLARLRDVWLLLILGAGAGPAVAASIGAAIFLPQGAAGSQTYGSLWSMWWVGDALGVVAVAPALLSLASGPRRLAGAGRVLELGALLAITIVGSGIVFGRPFDGHPWNYPFVLLPLAVWAASRFGQTAVSVLVLIITVTAVWGTTTGPGSVQPARPDVRSAGRRVVCRHPRGHGPSVRRRRDRAAQSVPGAAGERGPPGAHRAVLTGHGDGGGPGRAMAQGAADAVPVPGICRGGVTRASFPGRDPPGRPGQHLEAMPPRHPRRAQVLRQGEPLRPQGRRHRVGIPELLSGDGRGGCTTPFRCVHPGHLQGEAGGRCAATERNPFPRRVQSGIVPMVFWNTRGEVIEANETSVRLIGRTRSELEAGTLHCTT